MRYWRILNIDDQWGKLGDKILSELLVYKTPAGFKKEELEIKGVAEKLNNLDLLDSYIPADEPNFASYDMDALVMEEKMLEMVQQKRFPIAGRMVKLSNSWKFIELLAEKNLRPDLCLLDVKLDFYKNSEDENTLREIISEIEGAINSLPEQRRGEILQAFRDEIQKPNDICDRAGIYIMGKVVKLFKKNKPDIYLYTESIEVQKELVPMIFSGIVNVWSKNALIDKWDSIIRELQVSKITEGEVNSITILNAINEYRNYIDSISDENGFKNIEKDYETYKEKLKSLLTTEIGVLDKWTFVSFFVFNLNWLIENPINMTRPELIKKSLQDIEDLLSISDLCKLLTNLIQNTAFILFAHGGDPDLIMQPSGKRIIWDDFLNYAQRTIFYQKLYSESAKLEIVEEFEDLSTIKNTVKQILDYINDQANWLKLERRKVNGISIINLIDFSEGFFIEAEKIKSRYRQKVKDLISIFPDNKELKNEKYKCLIYCMPPLMLKTFIGVILRQGKENHYLSEISYDDKKHYLTFNIINTQQGISRDDLMDTGFFNPEKSGGFFDSLPKVKGWINLEIHSDSTRRNPHKIPYKGKESKSSFSDQEKTLFQVSFYCVKK